MFSDIKKILGEIRKGGMVIVTDDEARENEGDLVMAAEFAAADKINFIIKNAKGLLCCPMEQDSAERLNLTKMYENNQDHYKTNWLMSVDAKKGVTTGISAFDRARTFRTLACKKTRPCDLARPGHVFPLLSKPNGVLSRAGHTEASVDLMKLAGLRPFAVICEIIKEDGKMARLSDLKEFSKLHNIKMISIEKIIEHRRKKEKAVEFIADSKMPTEYGDFKMRVYKEKLSGLEHVALIMGEIKKEENILTRVHSECLTGDVLSSKRCDCGQQLKESMRMIAREKKGVILYMRQEGRGIGLGNKIKAYRLQDKGLDTVEANNALGFKDDLRDYGSGAQILCDLGVKKIKLMTNNPRKVVGIKGFGIEIEQIVPIKIRPNRFNKNYMLVKKNKLGHWI